MSNTSNATIASPQYPGTNQLVLVAFATIVSLLAVALNVLVLATMMRTPSLRRLQNVLVASLAVADLMRTTLVIPLYIVLLTGSSAFTADSAGCVVYRTLLITTQMAVAYGATLIGVERAFLIGRPLVYQRVVTRRRLTVFVAVGWSLCSVFGVLQSGLLVAYEWPDEHDDVTGSTLTPPLQFPVSDQKFSSATCFLNWSVFNVSLDLFVDLVFPFLILVVSYAVIFCVVRSQMRRIAAPPSTAGGGVLSDDGRATGSNTWMTSLSASRNITDVEEVNNDCPNMATISGHVNVRRILVTSSSRRHSTQSLSRVNPTCRVLIGIAEDETPRDDDKQGTSGSGSGVTMVARPSSSRRVGVTSSDSHHQGPPTGHTGADLRLTNRTVGDVRLPITSSLFSDSLNPTSSSPIPYHVTSSDDRSSENLFQLNNTEATMIDGYAVHPRREISTISRSMIDGRAPAAHRFRSVSLTVESAAEKVPSMTSTTRRSSGPPAADRRFRPMVSPSTDAKTIPEESSSAPGSLGTGPPRPSVVSLALKSLGGMKVTKWRPTISRNKAARMTLIVIGTFVACWLPIGVVHFIRVVNFDVYSSMVSYVAFDVTVLISFVGSLADPLVYNFYSAEFRRSAARVLTCNRNKFGSPFY